MYVLKLYIYNMHTYVYCSCTVVSRLSTQLEPRSFVHILPIGAYFRRSIPRSPAFRCNVEETDWQAPE
jgi:hypothetical protein